MPKVNEEQNPAVPWGQPLKDNSLKAEPSFTPAPWMVIPDTYHRGTISIVAPDATFKGQRYADGLPIATLPSRMGIGEPEYGNGYYEKREDAEGNARLIAAAPALYDACKTMMDSLNGSPTNFAGMLVAHRKLDAALAKVNAPKQEK